MPTSRMSPITREHGVCQSIEAEGRWALETGPEYGEAPPRTVCPTAARQIVKLKRALLASGDHPPDAGAPVDSNSGLLDSPPAILCRGIGMADHLKKPTGSWLAAEPPLFLPRRPH